MTKHQEILDYLEGLPIGKQVSVRSISNHLSVSEGTAYRAIKEAENRGLVETRPRSGTVRVEQKVQVRLEKLTYAEIAKITESDVVAGRAGLKHEFSRFSIGAMTKKNVGRYLVKGGLLIVGDREEIQVLALENKTAILITGGFAVSDRVLELSQKQGIPVMVTAYDTFTVASMINRALSNVRIKTDIKTVAQVYSLKSHYGYLNIKDTVNDYHRLVRKNNHVRYPVIDDWGKVRGVVTMRDVSNQDASTKLAQIVTKPVTTKPETSLATVAQRMIVEDFAMFPVVDDDNRLLGVISRKLVLENLQELNHDGLHTISDQIIASLKPEGQNYGFRVEPAMIDNAGNLTNGVLSELFKETALRALALARKKNIIIEQMMIYFLQAVQIDDDLILKPKIVRENRRSALVDIEVNCQERVVCKALITSKVN
ncbi:CBS-HotDog domain-containing transcription factor SpxR [Streptococcus downei]|uniref:Cytosolic protein containing multiple CBS domains n=1 Tax=Streptococcus downei MFe28 TaxID=764290 RepID=A0A380JFS0_STRDO|nr:CBS-HotDog domain-containing transcription factor SpxR [Streptococcus downei]EFQ57917.1 DRTGG domain protein [Streptococcus downei F0415]SUN36814.1 cytosolic protein containing multiple CBS domains [Streptococcus downei MFe28]